MAINKILYDTSGEEIVDQNGNVTVYSIDGTANRVNKVQYGQTVLLDVTDTTAIASDVALGETFYTKDGVKRTGTKSDASPIDVDNSTGTVSDETLIISSGGGSATTDYITLRDSSETVTSDNPNYILLGNVPEEITAGDRYRVTWNNTVYTCTAVVDSIIGSQYGATYGNPAILSGNDDGSNAPFCVFQANWSSNEKIVATTANANATVVLKIEKIVQGGNATLGTKSITANGTYNASSDSLDGYSQVTVNVASQSPTLQNKTVTSNGSVTADSGYDGLGTVTVNVQPNLQSKTATSNGTVTADNGYDGLSSVSVSVSPTLQNKTVTPTTSSQSVTSDSGYDGLDTVTVNAIPSNYIVPSGSQTLTSNNTYDVTSLAQVVVNVSGASKNVQIAQGVNRVNTTNYTAVSGQTLTVAETGKYDIYWSGYRSSTSGTSGSQLYIDDTAYGSANTTFSNNGQSVHLTNVSLTENQVIEVRARARNTSYYMYISNLTIIQS